MKKLILFAVFGFFAFTVNSQTTVQKTKKEDVKSEQTQSKTVQAGSEKMSDCVKHYDGKPCTATCKESKACTGIGTDTKSCTCVCKDGTKCSGTLPDGKACTCVCHEGKKCTGVCNGDKKSD